MTIDEAKALILDILGDIAPEVDRSAVDHRVDLTDQLDLDSMDYLNWMVAISKASGVEIAQRDISRFLTIDGAATYLSDHTQVS